MCNNTGMSEMPLEPDSPDDEDHYASEDWYTDGGSHLEMIIDWTIWPADEIDAAGDMLRAAVAAGTDAGKRAKAAKVDKLRSTKLHNDHKTTNNIFWRYFGMQLADDHDPYNVDYWLARCRIDGDRKGGSQQELGEIHAWRAAQDQPSH